MRSDGTLLGSRTTLTQDENRRLDILNADFNCILSPRVKANRSPDPSTDRVSSSIARRRLMFANEIFRGEKIYLDLRVQSESRSLENEIINLGGTVDKFLSKDVTQVVTDKKCGQVSGVDEGQGDSPGDPNSPSRRSPISSPIDFNGSRRRSSSRPRKPPTVLSRGQALLLKSSSRHSRSASTDILTTARLLGIRVVHVNEILKLIQKEKQKNDPTDEGGGVEELTKISSENPRPKKPKSRSFKGNYVKIEDSSNEYRPSSAELQKLPALDLDASHEGSPFDTNNVIVSKKTKTQRETATVSKSKQNVTSTKTNAKTARKQSGYCECCDTLYDDLKKHLHSKEHIEFSKKEDNFAELDTTISQLPNMDDLVLEISSCLNNIKSPETNNENTGVETSAIELTQEEDAPSATDTSVNSEINTILSAFRPINKEPLTPQTDNIGTGHQTELRHSRENSPFKDHKEVSSGSVKSSNQSDLIQKEDLCILKGTSTDPIKSQSPCNNTEEDNTMPPVLSKERPFGVNIEHEDDKQKSVHNPMMSTFPTVNTQPPFMANIPSVTELSAMAYKMAPGFPCPSMPGLMDFGMAGIRPPIDPALAAMYMYSLSTAYTGLQPNLFLPHAHREMDSQLPKLDAMVSDKKYRDGIQQYSLENKTADFIFDSNCSSPIVPQVEHSPNKCDVCKEKSKLNVSLKSVSLEENRKHKRRKQGSKVNSNANHLSISASRASHIHSDQSQINTHDTRSIVWPSSFAKCYKHTKGETGNTLNTSSHHSAISSHDTDILGVPKPASNKSSEGRDSCTSYLSMVEPITPPHIAEQLSSFKLDKKLDFTESPFKSINATNTVVFNSEGDKSWETDIHDTCDKIIGDLDNDTSKTKRSLGEVLGNVSKSSAPLGDAKTECEQFPAESKNDIPFSSFLTKEHSNMYQDRKLHKTDNNVCAKIEDKYPNLSRLKAQPSSKKYSNDFENISSDENETDNESKDTCSTHSNHADTNHGDTLVDMSGLLIQKPIVSQIEGKYWEKCSDVSSDDESGWRTGEDSQDSDSESVKSEGPFNLLTVEHEDSMSGCDIEDDQNFDKTLVENDLCVETSDGKNVHKSDVFDESIIVNTVTNQHENVYCDVNKSKGSVDKSPGLDDTLVADQPPCINPSVTEEKVPLPLELKDSGYSVSPVVITTGCIKLKFRRSSSVSYESSDHELNPPRPKYGPTKSPSLTDTPFVDRISDITSRDIGICNTNRSVNTKESRGIPMGGENTLHRGSSVSHNSVMRTGENSKGSSERVKKKKVPTATLR